MDSGRLGEASADEIIGLITAADRAEAAICYLKHAAATELIRRRPAPGCTLTGPSRIPDHYLDSAGDEVKWALAETRQTADGVLSLAHDLEVKLPGTSAAFRAGLLRHSKVQIIARPTTLLDAAEARKAEALVLDRARLLSPGALRHAIALAGRQLPPAEVLAADQRITWWARQLQAAGLEGDMDQLRARAYLDILLDQDSRPLASRGTTPDSAGADHPAGPHRPPGSGGNIPAGFAGRNHLTIPLTTLLGLADRPGELDGLGPVDPWLSRDLAHASAANPKTAWCLSVTDSQGRAAGHACARPEPRRPAANQTRTRDHTRSRRSRPPPGGTDPPGTNSTGFTFTPIGPGPPGGYGTWRFTTGVPGQRAWIIKIDPIPTGPCDHRHQAKGHDPGIKLHHLTEVRYATCTGPACRRPAATCDFEHNVPYEAGGRTCLCNGGPKCRHDHRLKQDPRWKVEQHPDGTFTWITPTGRQYTTEPTRYPV